MVAARQLSQLSIFEFIQTPRPAATNFLRKQRFTATILLSPTERLGLTMKLSVTLPLVALLTGMAMAVNQVRALPYFIHFAVSIDCLTLDMVAFLFHIYDP
jgi:hypothetical protein